MATLREQVSKKNGYTLHVLCTDQFKTNTIVWKMKAPLSRETVTLRALLPHVLQSGTNKLPSTTELRSYLDNLYGANLFVDLAKKGEYHVMTFTLEIANEKFLKDSTPLLKKGMEFITDLFFHPHTEDGAFHLQTVEKEKRTLKKRIQSVYDDKMRYSSARLVEEMCETEPYALQANGVLEDVDAICAKTLYEYFQQALQKDEIDVYVIGDVQLDEVEQYAGELISLNDRTPELVSHTSPRNRSEVKIVKEPQDVQQGKLNIGYRTHVTYQDEEYFALQLFNGIFGGFSHSKLFMNVREKASLAYYAASRLESHKGLMMVMSGIDVKNFDQAVQIIDEQLQAMKKGEFSEAELEQTKAVLQNQILETVDTPRGMVEILYHNVVARTNRSLDEWMERIHQTTKEEIIDVAQRVEVDTIYFITSLEGEQA
jgi:predicted Zn-dependent peptidase